jgi:hypothetical protein
MGMKAFRNWVGRLDSIQQMAHARSGAKAHRRSAAFASVGAEAPTYQSCPFTTSIFLRGPEKDNSNSALLALAAAGSLALALGLTACTQVAGYNAPSLVRVIDASYIAPAVDVTVESVPIADNIGLGTITQYGSITPTNSTSVQVAAATGGSAMVETTASFLSGKQESVFLTDNGAAAHEYIVTVLEDQSVAAPSGESSFRFLNQAPKTGAVDVYMVAGGTTLANSVPLVANLPVGSTAGYVTFNSQTVTIVVTPAGSNKAKYTSKAIALTGGEVRTALIMDTQLTANPPVNVYLADDVN